MNIQFIEVLKVSEKERKNEDETSVVNPITRKPVVDYDVKIETISTADIKSYRKWSKNRDQQDAFKNSELTIIYFKSPNQKYKEDSRGRKRTSQPEMIICESVESFNERLGAKSLTDEQRERVMG